MVGPLTKETPLQIVSVFSFEAGEALISPATELLGFIVHPRTEGGFGKEPLRTLLLDPVPAAIKARRLLYVALGSRGEFSLERVKALGTTAMRETIRLGVEHMAFAPIARDQGVTSLPPDDVAAAFVEGALVEYQAERRASNTPIPLQDVTYEAGPPFIEAVTRAVARGVEAAHARSRASAPVP
jgi:Cytosol aminopeptidase family, N-terminal domain